MTLKYLFKARFVGIPPFEQTPEDQDSQDPSKSAFTEYLRLCEKYTPLVFSLSDGVDTYLVNLGSGVIFKNGFPIYQPDLDLEGKDARVIYFRQVQQSIVVPATFINPRSYGPMTDGQLLIVDRQGNDHIFPDTSELKKEQIMDTDGKVVGDRYMVYPTKGATSVKYILGWQATIDGKNVQKTIELS